PANARSFGRRRADRSPVKSELSCKSVEASSAVSVSKNLFPSGHTLGMGFFRAEILKGSKSPRGGGRSELFSRDLCNFIAESEWATPQLFSLKEIPRREDQRKDCRHWLG